MTYVKTTIRSETRIAAIASDHTRFDHVFAGDLMASHSFARALVQILIGFYASGIFPMAMVGGERESSPKSKCRKVFKRICGFSTFSAWKNCKDKQSSKLGDTRKY